MGADKVDLAAAVALAATGIFAGQAVFITCIEHPAAMATSVNSFYKYFPKMFARVAPMQSALAVLGTTGALLSASKASGKEAKLLWSTSGALLAAVLPYTLVAMMPTNKIIIKQDETNETTQAELLKKWGKLHSVRTVLSCVAFAIKISLVASNHP